MIRLYSEPDLETKDTGAFVPEVDKVDVPPNKLPTNPRLWTLLRSDLIQGTMSILTHALQETNLQTYSTCAATAPSTG
jgi:hypothetical protein